MALESGDRGPAETALKADPLLAEHDAPPEKPRGRYLAVLSLTALGIVYGDIGTSPIYALRESLHGSYGVDASRLAVLGSSPRSSGH